LSSVKKQYLNPAFVVCLSVLMTVAVAKEAIIHALGVHMVKEPIALQHSFDDLDETVLLPYEVKQKSVIDGETLESLGTENYIQWLLEDQDAAPTSPTRFCSLFLTYYTGNPDMVPHVPDECYVGAGTERLSAETLSLRIKGIADDKIGLQYLMFGKTSDSLLQKEEKFSVQYFFHVNGQYKPDRTQTRLALGSNWFCKYSYFCKVEWRFYGMDSYGFVYADKEQTLQASKKLLERLLPELEKNHWPDWEKIKNE